MQLNIVPARTGMAWATQGVRTFWRQPLAMIGLFFLFMLLFAFKINIHHWLNFGGAGHGFDAPTELAVSTAAFWRSPRAVPRAAYAPHVRDAAWADVRTFFDLPQDASGP